MKKRFFPVFLFFLVLFGNSLGAEEVKAITKYFEVVSKYHPVSNVDQKDPNNLVYYRLGWNTKDSSTIAIQFANLGYGARKLKFAIKDVTSKKLVILDPIHRSRFGLEVLKAESNGKIWSGPIDNIRDGFSLRVWEDDGDEMDKETISIKDKQ
jgi:hypothetical protein